MHFSGGGFVHFELIDPDTGRGAADRGRRRGRTGLYPSPPGGRAAAPLPQPRPRPDLDRPLRLRPHRAAGPLHRPHRRHADRARRQRLPLGAARSRRPVRPGGQRRHLGAPARRGLPPEPAAPDRRRARGGRAGRPRRAHPRPHPRGAAGRHRDRAGAERNACRAAPTSRSWSTGRRRADRRVISEEERRPEAPFGRVERRSTIRPFRRAGP